MLNYDKVNIPARQRSPLESPNRKVMGRFVTEHIPRGFCFLEDRKMGKIIDLTGKRYGRWTVIEERGRSKNGNVLWKCICDCGNIVEVLSVSLRNNLSKSCGCLKKELMRKRFKKHGCSYRAEYNVWGDMIQRCTNKKCFVYKHYGGRGIRVCQEWRKSFKVFFNDMGPRPRGTSIERINNELGYFPGNCIWANKTIQVRNRRLSPQNSTGVNGIYVNRQGKYCAGIKLNYKQIYLGSFKTIEEATEARRLGEIKYWGENHG